MSEARLLERLLDRADAMVWCGAGHRTRADVFVARYQHTDMDGEPLQPYAVMEFEPPTCVSCGTPIVRAL